MLAPALAQAEAALGAGDIAAAGAKARQLLELAPGREEALMLLYRISRQQNRPRPPRR